ncbi:MAG: alpha/beta hydrolase [Oceanicaulis sp.]
MTANHAWGRRGAVRVDGLAVHYRRAGPEGAPAVLALHGSPESASALADLAAVLSDRFDVIAPDTPGNGLSEALPGEALTSGDLARAALSFMDALGLDRPAVYGFHTGAATAMELALIAPDRVSGMVLDGYPVWTKAERESLLSHYLVSFPPVWDGAHLASIWARLEEQRLFFPWYDRRLSARMDLPPAPLALRLRRLRDFLTAGPAYVPVYRTALERRGEEGPDRVSVPTLIGASDPDPLSVHLDRIESPAPTIDIERWGADRPAAFDRIAAFIADHPGAAAGPDPGDPVLLRSLARPEPVAGWTPDDHGGFLLQIWRTLRLQAIARAESDDALAAGLDPHALHARLIAAIQAETGL